MKYKSKTDLYFILTVMLFVITPIAASIISIYLDVFLIPLVIMFLLIDVFIIIPMWLHTVYSFEKDHLRIESGFFVKINLPYSSITSYGKSRGEFTSTALARSGITVSYLDEFGEDASVYISPQYMGFFLDEMRKNTLLDATDEQKKSILFFEKKRNHK